MGGSTNRSKNFSLRVIREEVRRQEIGDRRQEIGDRRQDRPRSNERAGVRRQETGVRTDRALTSVNAVGRQHSRSQETGDRRQEEVD